MSTSSASSTPRRWIKLLHPNAKLPFKKHAYDAGYDLGLVEDITLKPHSLLKVPTGVAIEIKAGEYGRLACRSSITKLGVSVLEAIIDQGYTGQINVYLYNHSTEVLSFAKGTRIYQIIFEKINYGTFYEVMQVPLTDRGTGQQGSTGTTV